jgi:uncharacterized protein YndB with AHSA1/START domain
MIQKTVLLRCPAERAFQLFTEQISDWWPKTHRPTKDPESRLFIEPAGRFWELSRDGREVELGRVLAWDPPRRLEFDFYLGTNPSQPTAVEVIFTSESEGTRVTIHHRPKSESQDLWSQRAPIFEKSWEAVLAALTNR